MNTTLLNGNCLELMKTIQDGTVNLVLTDPPYNIGKSSDWDKYKHDEYIAFMGEVFKQSERILAHNGTLIYFHSKFEYFSDLYQWIKDNTSFTFNSFIVLDKGNFRARMWKNPSESSTLRSWFNTCEYAFVFTKGDENYSRVDKTGWERVCLDVNNFSNLRKYSYDMLVYIGGGRHQASKKSTTASNTEEQNISSTVGRRSIFDTVGGKADHFTRYGSTQWSLPTEETYNELISIYNLREWSGFREYEDLRREYEDLRREYEDLRPVHNVDAEHKNVWQFHLTGERFHPCQKPTDILERFINCHTHKGDTVLDPFMGSGSTGVACKNTERNFIGIEMDADYFDIAGQRLA